MTIINSLLRKASGAIHIKPNRSLSLIERKLSNILLKNACQNLLTKDIHEIPIRDLMESLGWGASENVMDLKNALRRLRDTSFEFNIFKKNKEVWMCTSLISAIKFEEGICFYEYPNLLKGFLHQPRLYARLDLLVSNQFKNKYSLSLWEYFKEYMDTKTNKPVIETEWVCINEFVESILQLDNKKHTFMRINNRYIKPILKEINELSDITVSAQLKKRVRTVTHIRFSIKRKISYQPALDINLPMKTVDEEEEEDKKMEKSKSELVAEWKQNNPENVIFVEDYARLIKKADNPDAYAYKVIEGIVFGRGTIDPVKSQVESFRKIESLQEKVEKLKEEHKKADDILVKNLKEEDLKRDEASKKQFEDRDLFLDSLSTEKHAELKDTILKQNPSIKPETKPGQQFLKDEIYKIAKNKMV